jgi:hypothetical protein
MEQGPTFRISLRSTRPRTRTTASSRGRIRWRRIGDALDDELHLLAGSLQARANAEPDQSLFGAIRIRVRRSICASEGVQIFGGAGFMRGVKVERIYREVKVNAIAPEPRRS